MPDDLAALVCPQPHHPHAVVENLFGNTAHLLKRFFVQPQQRADLLVHCYFRYQASAVAHREGKRPKLALLAFALQSSQMSPIHLCLLARRCFETSHRHGSCRTPLRVQPVLENGVSAGVVGLPQLSQKHLRIPHSRAHTFFQIGLERIQLAGTLCRSTGHGQSVPASWIRSSPIWKNVCARECGMRRCFCESCGSPTTPADTPFSRTGCTRSGFRHEPWWCDVSKPRPASRHKWIGDIWELCSAKARSASFLPLPSRWATADAW